MIKGYITLTIISSLLFLINTNCSQSTEPVDNGEGGIACHQLDPQFSYDNRLIVFQGQYDSIYAVHFVDTSGNYLGYILRDQGLLNSPTWAPDNDRLAVSIDGSIYIVNKNGSGLSRIIYSDQDFFCNWSPDGKFISYDKTICDPECGVSLYNLKDDSSKIVGQYGNFSSWSWDSKKIYYGTYFYDNKGKYLGPKISRINIETGIKDSLITVHNKNLYLEDCCVSPDEKEFLFVASYDLPVRLNIWKINLETGAMVQITFDGGNFPAYNHLGNKIVYTNTNLKEGGLWIMNSDGSNKKRLTKLER